MNAPVDIHELFAETIQRETEARIAWNDLLFGAACGLLVGMIATVGLAYAVAAVFL